MPFSSEGYREFRKDCVCVAGTISDLVLMPVVPNAAGRAKHRRRTEPERAGLLTDPFIDIVMAALQHVSTGGQGLPFQLGVLVCA